MGLQLQLVAEGAVAIMLEGICRFQRRCILIQIIVEGAAAESRQVDELNGTDVLFNPSA